MNKGFLQLCFLPLCHFNFVADRELQGADAQSSRPTSPGTIPRITLIGESGAGKSTLINSMFGRRVAKAGISTRGVTQKTTVYSNQVKGEMVTLVDTVGYHALDTRPFPAKREDLQDSDLIIFCSEIKAQLRTPHSERLAMQTIRDNYPDALDQLVIALTFANERVRGRRNVDKSKEMYKAKVEPVIKTWRTLLSEVLGEDVAKDIPVVPVGRHGDHHLGDVDWYTNLWTACGERASQLCSQALWNIVTSASTQEKDRRARRSTAAEPLPPEDSSTSTSSTSSDYQSSLSALETSSGVRWPCKLWIERVFFHKFSYRYNSGTWFFYYF